ncbi:MAG TPA: FtsQ-type POTRA domain-containing protein [Candidatus Limnocylindria bacterium]|jgi:cell division septal protein FtsQ
MSAAALRPRKRSAGHARRSKPALARRVGRRLPARGRILALVAFALLLAAGVTLVNGPWLRVERLAHAGERYTPAATLDKVLAAYRGLPLLAVDSRDIVARLRSLPAVASAEVSAVLPDELRVTIAEKQPAFTWVTSTLRLVGATDGTLIGELPPDAEVPADLADLPAIDDQRRRSRGLIMGDVIPADELSMALRLLEVEPALLGSASSGLSLRIDTEYGFVLVSAQPAWQAALGFYGLDPAGDEVAAETRFDQQAAAIRTLFASQPETSVRWVDARNPGRVYWAP